MGYLLDHCRFEKLSESLIKRCQSFSCMNDPGIDSFFHANSVDNFSDYERERMAVSHCFYTDDAHPEMVCAFSLSCTALRVDRLSQQERNRFNRKMRIPNNKRRAQYPAILIGQLCVFRGFGKNVFPYDVGKEMMDLIKTMALKMDDTIAARYLVVDATNNPKVLDYYERNGFFYLFESEEEEAQLVNIQKTRLMAFDLILLKA